MLNEKLISFIKKYHSYIFISVVSFLLGCGICCSFSISISGKRNSELAELERKLSEANTRIEIADRTITDCRNGLEELATEFDGNNNNFANIIDRLRRIQVEVKKMEETLSYYYRDINPDNSDRNIDNLQ